MATTTKTTRPDVTESYTHSRYNSPATMTYTHRADGKHDVTLRHGNAHPTVWATFATVKEARSAWVDLRNLMANEGYVKETTPTKAPQPATLDMSDAEESCPRHGAETKAAYDFGMHDATVITYHCGCATVFGSDSCGGGATLHRNYSDAAGHARFLVAKAKTW